jgi:hypothetical protein
VAASAPRGSRACVGTPPLTGEIRHADLHALKAAGALSKGGLPQSAQAA